jgi:putative hydrolase of the HAD superfamily
MPLLTFKALTFDVVGTLIDFERGMLDYLRLVAPNAPVRDEEFLIAYRAERAVDDSIFYPDDLERVWRKLAPKFGLPDTDKAAIGFRQSVAGRLPIRSSAQRRRGIRGRHDNTRAASAISSARPDAFDWTVTSDDTGTELDPKYFEWFRSREVGIGQAEPASPRPHTTSASRSDG